MGYSGRSGVAVMVLMLVGTVVAVVVAILTFLWKIN